jgi:hypothetical protein
MQRGLLHHGKWLQFIIPRLTTPVVGQLYFTPSILGMKKNEMIRAYGMNQKYKRCCRVSVKNMKGRDHFKDLGVGGSIILKWGDIICISHTPDSNQWQALMITVIKL